VNVHEEVLQWSVDRPMWQRDALRRLVQTSELAETDLAELVQLCKTPHGLADAGAAFPLAKGHLPAPGKRGEAVKLTSVFHDRGVNALAEGQTLRFGPSMTVVYGDNGAGKTGYTRILKNACRARGRELILGNVTSGVAPHAPAVTIRFQVGGTEAAHHLTVAGADDRVARVSVFDTQSAGVYLTEKTDVAFRPLGLDLFDKLVKACKAVRSRVETEQKLIATSLIGPLLQQVPEGTGVHQLLNKLTGLTKVESVHALSRLHPADVERLTTLEKSLADLNTNDPVKVKQQLTNRLTRVRVLLLHLQAVERDLSDEAIATVLAARTEGKRKSDAARKQKEATFEGLLPGTGTDYWKALWDSARTFSHGHAYPGIPFPVIDSGASCVLCQQDIRADAAERLKKFEAFVTSPIEQELHGLREKFSRLRRGFTDLRTSTEVVEPTLAELAIDHETLVANVRSAIESNERRRAAVASALKDDVDIAAERPIVAVASLAVQALQEHLERRITALGAKDVAVERKNLTGEIQELKARKLLSDNEQLVLDEIERKRKHAAYGQCLNDTSFTAVTQKSTSLTKAVVTQQLKASFADEIAKLGFRHVDVELKDAGGAEGVLYHKLVLTRAPGVNLPKVVSEGEQRTLSIAAFFAELCTADDPSGIVFDDPVSSLDFRWRDGVARRLVEEAKKRQVIVFTHDVVFLLLLKQYAAAEAVEQFDQHIRNQSRGAGVCAEELPWVAMPVKKKIGYIRKEWQAADKLERTGEQDRYEKEAKYLYGMLREAWERAIEEILLNNVVERFQVGVQTQRLKAVDIDAQDYAAIESGMAKCSKWLPGHDKAAADRAPMPPAAELKADIEVLETWIAAVRKRRS
jgi:energy-coupling factor transporter ATP-binding protein EcfA2